MEILKQGLMTLRIQPGAYFGHRRWRLFISDALEPAVKYHYSGVNLHRAQLH
jgi:hypothetical protein